MARSTRSDRIAPPGRHQSGYRHLAARAATSSRTLTRRFKEQKGTTPMTWLTRHQSHRAQCLLETTNTPVDQIGPLVGFPSPTTFRERFKDVVGVSPNHYRRAFRS